MEHRYRSVMISREAHKKLKEIAFRKERTIKEVVEGMIFGDRRGEAPRESRKREGQTEEREKPVPEVRPFRSIPKKESMK